MNDYDVVKKAARVIGREIDSGYTFEGDPDAVLDEAIARALAAEGLLVPDSKPDEEALGRMYLELTERGESREELVERAKHRGEDFFGHTDFSIEPNGAATIYGAVFEQTFIIKAVFEQTFIIKKNT